MKVPQSSFKIAIASVALVFVVMAGQMAARAVRKAKLSALFDGPTELCKRQEPEYYPRVVYDVSDYAEAAPKEEGSASWEGSEFATPSSGGEIPWVDGEAREDVEASMRRYAEEMSVDGTTSATPVARLRSPSVYRDRQPFPALQIVYPEDGSVFPPNLCPPCVEWDDPRNDLWQVSVRVGESKETFAFICTRRRLRFPEKLWERVRRSGVTEDARVQVKGVQRHEASGGRGTVQVSEPVRFRISRDAADNYIVYRLVAPPFSSAKTPDLFVRDIRKDEPELFLSARRKYCVNCHCFSSKQGNSGKLGLQVRSLDAAGDPLPVYLALYDIDGKSGYRVKLPFAKQMTTFMSWSPDETKLAFSANQKIVALKPILYETQLAGMAASDIAIYDLKRNEAYLVPGASEPSLLEIYPRWSPDGGRIVFSRSPVGLHPAYILFELYAMSVDDSGVGPAQPVEGAADNGRSNYFPRFSPDGKWFSFCQCDGGDLIRSSSDIYLKAGDLKGTARQLECNVPYAADSWHSWSSNGRWLVFASKRDGGVYATLYLTHIDDAGHASPAIRLPVTERPPASFNIPEFVAHRPSVRDRELFDAIRIGQEPHIVQKREKNRGGRDVHEEAAET